MIQAFSYIFSYFNIFRFIPFIRKKAYILSFIEHLETIFLCHRVFSVCVCSERKKWEQRLAEGDGGGLWCNEVKKGVVWWLCVCVGGVGVIERKSEWKEPLFFRITLFFFRFERNNESV